MALPHRVLPLIIFIATFCLAALFAWRTPPWLAPDEPAHYAYVQHVATTGRPPRLEARCYDEPYKNALTSTNFADEVDLSRFCYEGHQPPLFYYLAAPIYLLSDGSLLALRLFCALLGAGVAVAAWGIVRAVGGSERLALATAGMVALLPQHLAMIGSLNNDALTFLIVALSVWQMLRLLVLGSHTSHTAWLKLGFLVGLALLTKTLAWVVLPLSVLTLLLLRVKEPTLSIPSLTQRGLLVMAVAALCIVPWFGRNIAVYEGTDLLGLQKHDEIAVGQPRTTEEIERRGLEGTVSNGLQTTFNSFWGQFGWMKAPLKPREYLLLRIVSGAALLGLARWLWQRGASREGIDARALLLFAVWLFLNAGALFYYNLEFVQYQGRYLFPALTPLAFFFMMGLGALLPGRARPVPWLLFLLFLLYLDFLAVMERLPGMLTY
ncbi:MAG: glycosyltransferase family 39 protein [Ardenticatenales bacterium]|nr:glycosyltransferase family 39 protein [Ardenticatenales bacterium]